MPAAPILMDINVAGRDIPAIAQITKQGFVFTFDRRTGEPVWEIQELPVPQSNVPGEVTAATQPFPTLPAAFDRQGSTEDNLIDFTPELRAEALEIASNYVTGPLFEPPSVRGPNPGDTQGTIQLPGSQGGADVQGAAFDPETGYLIDLGVLKRIVEEKVVDKCDHKNLNLEVDFMEGIIPSTENFAVAIWNELVDVLPTGRLHAVRLFETENNWAEYRGE